MRTVSTESFIEKVARLIRSRGHEFRYEIVSWPKVHVFARHPFSEERGCTIDIICDSWATSEYGTFLTPGDVATRLRDRMKSCSHTSEI